MTLAECIAIIPAHAEEGRNWSPVSHTDLLAWQAEIERLRAIAEAAWLVRTEERDYTEAPDLTLRAEYRHRLHKLLDDWMHDCMGLSPAEHSASGGSCSDEGE